MTKRKKKNKTKENKRAKEEKKDTYIYIYKLLFMIRGMLSIYDMTWMEIYRNESFHIISIQDKIHCILQKYLFQCTMSCAVYNYLTLSTTNPKTLNNMKVKLWEGRYDFCSILLVKHKREENQPQNKAVNSSKCLHWWVPKVLSNFQQNGWCWRIFFPQKKRLLFWGFVTF